MTVGVSLDGENLQGGCCPSWGLQGQPSLGLPRCLLRNRDMKTGNLPLGDRSKLKRGLRESFQAPSTSVMRVDAYNVLISRGTSQHATASLFQVFGRLELSLIHI